MKITVLGCGSSAGVPMIGCRCDVCQSPLNENKRSRASILIEKGATKLLVDVSPDIREQALKNGISAIDAIIITHAHADHCHGIDDLRSFNYALNQALPLYATQETLDEVKQRFDYCFLPPKPEFGWFRPALTPHSVALDPTKPIQVSDELQVIPFQQLHGASYETMGLRVGNFAYSTDVNNLSENSLQTLGNLDVWLVDCLRYNSAPTHAHLALTLSWIERLKPGRAILTHMGHEFDFERLRGELPPNVEPAFDGLVIEL